MTILVKSITSRVRTCTIVATTSVSAVVLTTPIGYAGTFINFCVFLMYIVTFTIWLACTQNRMWIYKKKCLSFYVPVNNKRWLLWNSWLSPHQNVPKHCSFTRRKMLDNNTIVKVWKFHINFVCELNKLFCCVATYYSCVCTYIQKNKQKYLGWWIHNYNQ